MHNTGVLDWITRLARQSGASDPDELARALALILEGAQAREITSSDSDTPAVARFAARQVIRSAISRPAQATARMNYT